MGRQFNVFISSLQFCEYNYQRIYLKYLHMNYCCPSQWLGGLRYVLASSNIGIVGSNATHGTERCITSVCVVLHWVTALRHGSSNAQEVLKATEFIIIIIIIIISISITLQSCSSSVGIATGYGLETRGSEFELR
jgi:hypothetical protein